MLWSLYSCSTLPDWHMRISLSQTIKWKTPDTQNPHMIWMPLRAVVTCFVLQPLSLQPSHSVCYVCFRKLSIDPSGTLFAGSPCETVTAGKKVKHRELTAILQTYFQLIGEMDNWFQTCKPKPYCSTAFLGISERKFSSPLSKIHEIWNIWPLFLE